PSKPHSANPKGWLIEWRLPICIHANSSHLVRALPAPYLGKAPTFSSSGRPSHHNNRYGRYPIDRVRQGWSKPLYRWILPLSHFVLNSIPRLRHCGVGIDRIGPVLIANHESPAFYFLQRWDCYV